MSKTKDTLEDIPSADNEGNKAEVKLTHVALSMCNITGEGWSLVKIAYNPETGDVGTIEKKYTGEIRPYVEEQLRIHMVKEDIFNNGLSPWETR